jgi:hypothetical protein
MNMESYLPENHNRADKNTVSDVQPVTAFRFDEDISVHSTDLYEDEPAIAKAATWMLDADVDQPHETSRVPDMPLRYIQGLVHKNQIFLITNLLSKESQTVFQPQLVWTIGRNREAAIPLQDRAMSRRHAVLLFVPNTGFQLIDLNSMNGSFVNGKRIQQRTFLQDGDLIRLGNIDFTFFYSRYTRNVSSIHPEVLTRINAEQPQADKDRHVDYLELEEPEVRFRTFANS